MFDKLSIRYKLVVLLGLSLGLGLLVSSLLTLYSTFVAERQSSLRALHEVAAIISENMRAALAFHGARSASNILAPLRASPHILYARVEDGAGTLLGQFRASSISETEADAWRGALDRGAPLLPAGTAGESMEHGYHYVVHPIDFEGKHIGTLAIWADNGVMYAKMRQLMLLQVGASVLVLAGLLLLSLRLQLIFTRPIFELIAAMRRIGRGKDYTTTLTTNHVDEFGELYQGFNAMLEEIRSRDEKLSILAMTDALTGLANRGQAMEVLQSMATRTQRKAGTMGIILIDVDHFKQVNDTYGHPAGDQVLRDIAAILQANVRAYDLAARFGGEEFLVLCDEADLPTALDMAERIRAGVDQHAFHLGNGQVLHLSISLGVHVGTAAPEAAMRLVEAADQALYRAKQAGRNCVRNA